MCFGFADMSCNAEPKDRAAEMPRVLDIGTDGKKSKKINKTKQKKCVNLFIIL